MLQDWITLSYKVDGFAVSILSLEKEEAHALNGPFSPQNMCYTHTRFGPDAGDNFSADVFG